MSAKHKLLLSKLPFEGTTVPIGRSKEMIQQLLRKAGAEGIAWADKYRPRRESEVRFVRKEKLFKLVVPIQTADLDKNRKYISDYDWEQYMMRREAAMYRAMFYYLEGLLKAEQWGLMSFEEAFVGHGVINLPSGEEVTVREAILERHLEPGKALPAAPEAVDKGAIDVPYTVVGR